MSAIKEKLHDKIEAGMRFKERPILYSSPMVQAILDRRKRQTRRIVKGEVVEMLNSGWFAPTDKSVLSRCPYGKPGDMLWVRESWNHLDEGWTNIYGLPYRYKADWAEGGVSKVTHGGKWKPSIHMPRAACRIQLKIINIRVEKLNDISEEDAKSEGVMQYSTGETWLDYIAQHYHTTQFVYRLASAKASFKTLWDLINGRDSWVPNTWENNPWVWVIEFERI